MLRLSALIILLVSTFSRADTITWARFDFPPYYILEQHDEGKGRDEQIINLLASQMPGYKFEYLSFPSSRVVSEAAKPGNQLCILSLFKTPRRQRQLYFTDTPSTLGFPPGIAMMSRDALRIAPDVDKTGAVSLYSLLVEKRLHLGVAGGRSYNKRIDSLLSQTELHPQLFRRKGSDVLFNLMKMMNKGRLQMVIGYPDEQMYLAKRLGIAEQVRTFPIAEGGEHSKGFIGCSRNTRGLKHVQALDAALAQLRHNPAYADILRYWLPQDMHHKVDDLLNQ